MQEGGGQAIPTQHSNWQSDPWNRGQVKISGCRFDWLIPRRWWGSARDRRIGRRTSSRWGVPIPHLRSVDGWPEVAVGVRQWTARWRWRRHDWKRRVHWLGGWEGRGSGGCGEGDDESAEVRSSLRMTATTELLLADTLSSFLGPSHRRSSSFTPGQRCDLRRGGKDWSTLGTPLFYAQAGGDGSRKRRRGGGMDGAGAIPSGGG
jgi:hypothetical protein